MKIVVWLSLFLEGQVIDRFHLLEGLQRLVIVGPANVETSQLGAHTPLMENLIEMQGVVLHIDIFQPQLHHPDVVLVVFAVLIQGEAALQRLPELIVRVGLAIVFVPGQEVPPMVQWIRALVQCNGILPGLLVLGKIGMRLGAWHQRLSHVRVHTAKHTT